MCGWIRQIRTESIVITIYKLLTYYIAELPWGWNFNAHTHPIPTEKPVGIPTESPYHTESRNPPYPYPTPCVFLFDDYIILFFVTYAICM